jgi:membrane-associated phospholipid phosphatase
MSPNSLFHTGSHRLVPAAHLARSVPATPARGPTGRLLAAALGCLLVLALTCAVFVWTATGQHLDGALAPDTGPGGYIRQTTLIAPAQRVLSFTGDPAVLVTLLTLVLLTGVLCGRLLAGLAGVGVTLGSVAAAGILKLEITRPAFDVAGSTTHNSFPSGHVAGAMGLLLAIMFVLPARARWWLAIPGLVGVSVVAGATMVVGWHRFSDTLGAIALATMLGCLAAAALTHLPLLSPGRAAGVRRT